MVVTLSECLRFAKSPEESQHLGITYLIRTEKLVAGGIPTFKISGFGFLARSDGLLLQ